MGLYFGLGGVSWATLWMEKNLIIPTQVFLDSLVTPVVARALRMPLKLLHSYTDIRRTSYKTIQLDLSNSPRRGEHKKTS